MNSDNWLLDFSAVAATTDTFTGSTDHMSLLAAGLIGEAGSIVSEFKKQRRESGAYPAYRERMVEEVGDFLWYFVRLTAVVSPHVLGELTAEPFAATKADSTTRQGHLDFGAVVGQILGAISRSKLNDMPDLLRQTWAFLTMIAKDANVSLPDAAKRNSEKTTSRWPDSRVYAPLFDESFPVEEQLPRELDVEFLERVRHNGQVAVLLRCNGINFGDKLTDNIEDPDGYSFHDIFHFAYTVHLGWSPVVRALMRTKRKSNSKIDEGQDGARAIILEEAISAIIFSRAKHLNFFEKLDHVDLDLLKTVKEFVEGFEVAKVPLWQWETAILDGYRVFRELRTGRGGRVSLNLRTRELTYINNSAGEDHGRVSPSCSRG